MNIGNLPIGTKFKHTLVRQRNNISAEKFIALAELIEVRDTYAVFHLLEFIQGVDPVFHLGLEGPDTFNNDHYDWTNLSDCLKENDPHIKRLLS